MIKNNDVAKFLLIIVSAITVLYFGYWGYEWVNYVLSKMFNVATGSTFFDLLVGLIAMMASIPLFVGATMAWRDNVKSVDWLMVGTVGFILKNIFEITNVVYKLSLQDVVTAQHIRGASAGVGQQLFQIAFWVFVMVYFRKLMTKKIVDVPLSNSTMQ